MTSQEIKDLVTEVRRRSSGDSDLEHLAAAVGLGEDLSRPADAVIGHFVEAARQGGHSWAEIGSVLGVTRQAAQQQDSARRKRPGWRRSGRRKPGGALDRCTERMRVVLALAQHEAERLQHNFVGSEHLLLGLLHEGEGMAAHVLRDLGLDLDATRSRVEQIIGCGPIDPGAPDCGVRPFTPRAKRVLELAHKEALKLGHNYMGTEHALLGLLAEGEGVAAQVLVELGVELPGLRRRVLELVAGDSTETT